MEGNSFTNWSKVSPRHNALIQNIVNAPVHIIATLRCKTEYVMQQKNGKSIPEKMGLKAVQRDDTEYEFTVAFELNQLHKATISKDRTGLFKQGIEFILNNEVGEKINQWCCTDTLKNSNKSIFDEIVLCKDIQELHQIYNENTEIRDNYKNVFSSKKEELINNINIGL